MSETLAHPSTYIKAIWAGLTAFLGSLLVALLTLQSAGVDPVTPGQLGWIEWLTITLVTLGAFGGVFGLKNSDVPGARKAAAKAPDGG